MKKTALFTALILCFTILFAQAQLPVIDKVKFFENDTTVDATLAIDIGKLLSTRVKPEYLPASFTCKTQDSSITEKISVIARGVMRRQICYMPPLKLDFHTDSLSYLYKLGSLKLVSSCNPTDLYDQLLLKEYLIYKIYNLITEKSFRVRLLNLNYEDSRGKRKTISKHAFLIEDVKDLAKRNGCKALKDLKINGQSADRNQFTLFAVFEYFIGNTDWGVSANHNSVIILPNNDPEARPFVIPFDFDYSGLVNADYAVPDEGLDILNVRERCYRGYARTMEELNDAFLIFNQQKEKIYALVNNFELLTPRNRKDIIDYLDDFYKTISDPGKVKNIFIEKARTR